MTTPKDSVLDQWQKETEQSEFSLEKLNMKRHWDPDTYEILKLKNKRIFSLIQLIYDYRNIVNRKNGIFFDIMHADTSGDNYIDFNWVYEKCENILSWEVNESEKLK